MTWLVVLLAVAAAAYPLHLLALWMERRGWIYYRSRARHTMGLSGAMQALAEVFEPARHHVAERRIDAELPDAGAFAGARPAADPATTFDASSRARGGSHDQVAGASGGSMGGDERVRLISPAERSEGQPTPGMRREQAVSTDRSWAGHVTTEAGMVSGWHHHGDYESHIYVLSGAMRIESGPEGKDVVDAQPGDFVFVPPHVVHREGNPASTDATLIVVRAGSGEPVFNVEGPAGS